MLLRLSAAISISFLLVVLAQDSERSNAKLRLENKRYFIAYILRLSVSFGGTFQWLFHSCDSIKGPITKRVIEVQSSSSKKIEPVARQTPNGWVATSWRLLYVINLLLSNLNRVLFLRRLKQNVNSSKADGKSSAGTFQFKSGERAERRKEASKHTVILSHFYSLVQDIHSNVFLCSFLHNGFSSSWNWKRSCMPKRLSSIRFRLEHRYWAYKYSEFPILNQDGFDFVLPC